MGRLVLIITVLFSITAIYSEAHASAEAQSYQPTALHQGGADALSKL